LGWIRDFVGVESVCLFETSGTRSVYLIALQLADSGMYLVCVYSILALIIHSLINFTFSGGSFTL
jgi:hypothetical protein